MIENFSKSKLMKILIAMFLLLLVGTPFFASEASLKVPTLNSAQNTWLIIGFVICLLNGFRALPVFDGKKTPGSQINGRCRQTHF